MKKVTPGSQPSSPVLAASLPWAFTQQPPLRAEDFCTEAKKRDIDLDLAKLKELWRVGALAPFVEVRDEVLHPPAPVQNEPLGSGGATLTELRLARNDGRLADPVELGFRPQVVFRPASAWGPTGRHWWNGLVYSRWQLRGLARFRLVLEQGKWLKKGPERRWRSRKLHPWELDSASRERKLVAVLVALEARYLPIIDDRWAYLTSADVDEWDGFRDTFDPLAIVASFQWDADDLVREADGLLIGADRVDPFQGSWSHLLRRAPQPSWDRLRGEALQVLDRRIAAEVLLRCYEDLAAKGQAKPLDQRPDAFHSSRERISYRDEPLDATLSSLGISPHPGVVIVVEGETEEILVPLVRDHMRIPKQAEVIQSVVLRGVGKDITKLAAFATAPMIESEEGGLWLTVKPPTYLMVFVDPDDPFDTPSKVETERQKIVDEIVSVLRAQGLDPDRQPLEALVNIRTWPASCFEFAHFDDDVLARALIAIHPDCGGMSEAALVTALGQQRHHTQDVKKVWVSWRPRVSKTDLARALWPSLQAALDAPLPSGASPAPVVVALLDAYQKAMDRPHGRFGLTGKPVSP